MIEMLQEADKMNRVRHALEICGNPSGMCLDKNGVKCPYADDVLCVDNLCKDAAAMIDALTAERDTWKQRAEAAESDINMCCPCEVCTRSCTYDKVNPYDECADFEWRGPCAENGGAKEGEENV